MFGLFERKKDKTQPEVATQPTAPGSSIQYSPDLIRELEDDHKALVEMYQAAADALERRSRKDLVRSLAQLKDALTGHLLKENLKLYTYMNRCYHNNPEGADLIKSFNSDMAQIGKTVFTHLNTYTAPEAKFDLVFKKEFDAIGEALTRRIQAEEKQLYPLYMTPDNY
ncbi:MAG: hemerythrin domain-containing protein [Gammaproteobacteria bacterium]|nr:hemerythrin domain-containing protein [Gammaproteobacteria bacterium]